MKLPHGLAIEGGVEPKPVFRVVIAYDDFAAGKRAMDTCNFLVSQFAGEIELKSSMWKFDVLRSTNLNQLAVDDAVEADVIIVANGRESGLPEEVKGWVNTWVPRKHDPAAALVALLDFTGDDTRESAMAHAFLEGAAATAKIDFLVQEIRSSGEYMPPLAGSSLRDWPPAPIDPAANRPSPEAWGIND
jgi:hypothetical protein